MKKKPQKPYWEMTSTELAEATREFDKPLPPSKVRPLSKAERERFERARSGPSGAIFISRTKKKKVTLQVDERLLDRMDKLAEARGVTRDEIVERSFQTLLIAAR